MIYPETAVPLKLAAVSTVAIIGAAAVSLIRVRIGKISCAITDCTNTVFGPKTPSARTTASSRPPVIEL